MSYVKEIAIFEHKVGYMLKKSDFFNILNALGLFERNERGRYVFI